MSDIQSLFLYIVFFELSILLISRYENEKRHKKYIFFAILLPIILSACRKDVGTDWSAYEWLITIIRKSDWKTLLEPGSYNTEIGYRLLLIIHLFSWLSRLSDLRCRFVSDVRTGRLPRNLPGEWMMGLGRFRRSPDKCYHPVIPCLLRRYLDVLPCYLINYIEWELPRISVLKVFLSGNQWRHIPSIAWQ